MGYFITAKDMEEDDKSKKIILHIDLDAFFAACEEAVNPKLRNKAVVIGANPMKGKGRGVVSTANYEARKYGIKSGMPITWAYRRNPNAVYLPVNFTLYNKVSENVMNILRKYGKVEQTGIDEAFLELHEDWEKSEKTAKKIQREIFRKEKVTASIGIAGNKLVAKIASDFRKPKGLTIVKPSEVIMFLSPLPVNMLQGVGPKTNEKLKTLGIETIKDLQEYPLEKLKMHLGENYAGYLKENAFGKDDSEVSEEKEEAKSIGLQETFQKDTKDEKMIIKKLNKMIEEIFKTAKGQNKKAKTIVIKVRYEDFATFTKQKKSKFTLDLKQAKAIAWELMLPFFKDKRKIRLIGISIKDFKVL